MTKAAIARYLGITRQSVHAKCKDGMPTDSIEAVEAWIKTRPKSTGEKPPRKPPADIEAEVEQVDGEGWRGITTAERLARHREQLESKLDFCSKEAKRWKDTDPELSRKWLTLASQLSARAPALELKLMEAMEKAHEIITTHDAQRTFTGYLMIIRGELERLAGSLAAKVNPSDPEHAREQIEAALTGIFKRLNMPPSVLP
jgi:hypothetical protein